MAYECGRNTYAGLGKEPGSWLFGVMGCGKWGCPTCGKRKTLRFRRGLTKFAVGVKAKYMLTLTLDPGKCSAEDSCDYIKQVWRKFRVYLERKLKIKLAWVWVLEFQKNGYAHFHILLNKGLSQKWVSKTWEKLGGGPIVDIRIVGEERVGAYLSKYLSKGFADELFKRFQRRYGAVRGAALMQKSDFQNVFVITERLQKIVERWTPKDIKLFDGVLSSAVYGAWPGLTLSPGA